VKEVVLAYDEGPKVGLGHRRRVGALAEAFRTAGLSTTEVSLMHPVSGECVVVDSYLRRADDREFFDGDLIVAVDDIDRDLAVDVVVDPSPGATATPHVHARCVLAGAEYALIGPGLPLVEIRPVRQAVARVLVTLGGADHGAFGGAIAAAIAALLSDVEVQLAVGPWSTSNVDSRIHTVHVTDGLGPWLAAADIVVTAGGVTLLEALCLGVPTIVLEIADNQRRATVGAVAARAALAVGLDPRDIAVAVHDLAGDPARRRALATAASTLVDRGGPKRVVESVLVGTGS
jgi:UDP-2,4-diacetamido-2,4,6-trideoxy-beta-L-altropyranose hydrolase